MSLRLKINLLVAMLVAVFMAVLMALEVDNTRRGVREEVEAASRVAQQLLARLGWVYQQNEANPLPPLAEFLARLGRVRANDITLLDEDGQTLYRSPPSGYKVGREAPAWFARLVGPEHQGLVLEVGRGRLLVEPDASRAVLDGWDELLVLLQIGAVFLVLANGLLFWIVGRAVSPFERIVAGLTQMEQGAYHTRLPPMRGREAGAMCGAFNRMAQGVEETLAARRSAAEARARLNASRELALTLQTHIEEERRAIARELHDELGQSITAVRSLATAILRRSEGKDDSTTQAARLLVETAGGMYEAVHQLIPRLRPMALDNLGLAAALGDLVGDCRLRHPEVAVELQVGVLPEVLDGQLGITAFRVVQESITNALRHAGASRIRVAVGQEGEALKIRVADNGCGMPPQAAAGGFGLKGLVERVELLGGTVLLGSGAEGGVEVAVSLPRVLAGKEQA